MDATEPGWLNLFLLLPALGSLLLPGWLLGRCLGTPFPVLTTFLGSAAIFFNSVLLLDALRVPLHAGPVGLLLVFWSLALAGWAYRTGRLGAPARSLSLAAPAGEAWIWLAPVALALASILLRAIIDPLSGWDNYMRWDYLARLLVRQESLAHYPPVTAEDFRVYSWCDGIPPLVPMLNFWIYAATGSTAPVLTAVRVGVETMLTGMAVYTLAGRLWGVRTGWMALAALATSSLLLWSAANGQETGLLTVSLVTLVLLLEEHRAGAGGNVAGWAGLAAGVGAISREYGLAYVLFGAGVLVVRRAGGRAIGWFLAAAVLVAAPWYLRNGIVTGNPLFPHSLGGLFPTNPVHVEMMKVIASHWGLDAGYVAPGNFVGVLAVVAGPLLLLGAIGAIRAGRKGAVCVAAIGLTIGLWWWAIPYTAGGWNYALRVLAPGLVLCGVLAGGLAALSRSVRYGLLAVFTVLAVDAGRRAWLLPITPLASAWPYSWDSWRGNNAMVDQMRLPRVWDILIEAAQGADILVDHPAYHVAITERGGHAVPWYSPKINGIFAKDRAFQDVRRELQARGVRFIALRADNPTTVSFCQKFPFLHELVTKNTPTVQLQNLEIYDLNLLPPAPASSP